MNSSQIRACLLTVTLGLCAAANAQETVPIEYYRPLRNSFSVGVRVIGGSAKVNFSNLGKISPRYTTSGTETGPRSYDNGTVSGDGQRLEEINNTPTATATVTSTSYTSVGTPTTDSTADTTTVVSRRRLDVGGRYQILRKVTVTKASDGTPISTEEDVEEDLTSYQDGFTRSWSYVSPSQGNAASRTVDMSIYSVTPGTSTAEAESDRSTGVELQFAHVFKRYKRFEWGLNFSAGSSFINAKTSKVIRGNLRADVDRYALRAGSALPIYSNYVSDNDGEERETVTVVTGTEMAEKDLYDYENEHYLSRSATRSVRNSEVDVYGNWQIKGAYYLLRAGPIVRFPFAKKWAATVSAGGAAAYVGTNFVVDEYVLLPDVNSPIGTREFSEEKRILPGYYADINIERWLTVRTGFYAGFSYEKVSSYDQTLRGRTAKVDIGGGSGFRFGIITRF